MSRFNFTTANIPSLTGKVALVTGGNSGIGEVAVQELARAGAKVYVSGRSQQRVAAAIARVKLIVPDASLESLIVDFSLISDSIAGARKFLNFEDRLDILVANAGIASVPASLTAEGWEIMFATNHLGHFAFVTTLLPLLKQTSQNSNVRVVITSSALYLRSGAIDYEDLRTAESGLHGNVAVIKSIMKRYSRSKLANVQFAVGLSEKIKDYKNIFVNVVHPGVVSTNITNNPSDLGWAIKKIVFLVQAVAALSAADGSKTILFAATDERIVKQNIKGKLINPSSNYFSVKDVVVVDPNEEGSNQEHIDKLWATSEEAVKQIEQS
ncbi:hypothetical protein V1514DRAFT_194593 [Lipomyces japonicus]|uniref:uncharacterized protein n=1 Tax=Lipomyces japonicus TaxID=56871 RepID=UPI0034D00D44